MQRIKDDDLGVQITPSQQKWYSTIFIALARPALGSDRRGVL
jgi:hypothetical protein